MLDIAVLLSSIAILVVAVVYAYTMLIEVRQIRKELDNLRKKYEK